VNQGFAHLTKKIKKLEKVLKKSGKKVQKHRYKDSSSDSKYEVGLGSTRKVVKLGETVENTSLPLPSPMKATPTTIASNSNDISTASVSNANNVMMMSSGQKEEILNTNSIPPNKDPPEGKTTALVAVMRSRPKHSHHRQRSNKHYKQKLVQVLLNSGSDGNLDFVDKDKPMLPPSLKRLVPQMWNTLNGMFQTKCKAEIELNFFEYSTSKRYLAEPDIVQYNKNNKPQYGLILGVKAMKKYGIIVDFQDKMITVDQVKLPLQNINYLQGSSTLRALKFNHSLAMELHNTQDATKRVTRILDAKYKKDLQGSSTLRVLKLNHSLAMGPHSTHDATTRVKWILDVKYMKSDLQSIVRDDCKHLSANQQKKLLQLLKKYELLFDGT
jgi:hypothetical protein